MFYFSLDCTATELPTHIVWKTLKQKKSALKEKVRRRKNEKEVC